MLIKYAHVLDMTFSIRLGGLGSTKLMVIQLIGIWLIGISGSDQDVSPDKPLL